MFLNKIAYYIVQVLECGQCALKGFVYGYLGVHWGTLIIKNLFNYSILISYRSMLLIVIMYTQIICYQLIKKSHQHNRFKIFLK